jgi:hypothetical protein
LGDESSKDDKDKASEVPTLENTTLLVADEDKKDD